jgi:hypothetical protein
MSASRESVQALQQMGFDQHTGTLMSGEHTCVPITIQRSSTPAYPENISHEAIVHSHQPAIDGEDENDGRDLNQSGGHFFYLQAILWLAPAIFAIIVACIRLGFPLWFEHCNLESIPDSSPPISSACAFIDMLE